MMKAILAFSVGVLLVSACGLGEERPNISMVADINNLSPTTDDTLVVTRGIVNAGATTVWMNATIPAYEMVDASGGAACVDPTLDQQALELVRIPSDSAVVLEDRYVLSELSSCDPGTYALRFVAHFRNSESAPESFSLRTNPTTVVITAPTTP